MTQKIVDLLEVIDVDEHDSERTAELLCLGNGLIEPIVQHVSVGQPRELVVMSKAAKCSRSCAGVTMPAWWVPRKGYVAATEDPSAP